MSLTILYIILLAVMFFAGVYFEDFSNGLAVRGPDGPFYCRELLSSGGDDDAMVVVLSLFVIPLIVRLLRFRRAVSRYEVGLFYVCAGISILSLSLASLDCADVLYTAFVIPDRLLAVALIAIPTCALILWKLRSER